jgi:hypothetical protein
MSLVDQTAASLVRRSRAGDQNATATLYRIGEEARKGGSRAVTAFQSAKAYIEGNPEIPFTLGAEPAAIMDAPRPGTSTASSSTAMVPYKPAPPTAKELEMRKPVLPRGFFDKLFHPEWAPLVMIKAHQYRHGAPAAAAVLASGPPLTNQAIQQFGASQFGSEESTQVFYHGVRFPDDAAWKEVAPHLDVPLRRCLAIGQCVGRARRLQQVRQQGSSISSFSPTIGWELGE